MITSRKKTKTFWFALALTSLILVGLRHDFLDEVVGDNVRLVVGSLVESLNDGSDQLDALVLSGEHGAHLVKFAGEGGGYGDGSFW